MYRNAVQRGSAVLQRSLVKRRYSVTRRIMVQHHRAVAVALSQVAVMSVAECSLERGWGFGVMDDDGG
jgi:hypothetical protein